MSRALAMVTSGVEAEGTWPGTKPQEWEHEADGNAMGNGPVNLGNGPVCPGNGPTSTSGTDWGIASGNETGSNI
jgi:hypothetical protein